jgi:hypothetical protein
LRERAHHAAPGKHADDAARVDGRSISDELAEIERKAGEVEKKKANKK